MGHDGDLLQWGRGLKTPEMPDGVLEAPRGKQLQWGRGLKTPEIWLADVAGLPANNASMGPGS